MRDFVELIGGLFVIVAVVVGVAFGGYYIYRELGPRYETTRREIIEQSKAFREIASSVERILGSGAAAKALPTLKM